MYGKKLCLGLSGAYGGLSAEEQVRLFARVGFDGFFASYGPFYNIPALKKIADADGLIFQSVHAPFTGMAHFWNKTERTEAAIAELIACTRATADAQVPIMVMHTFIGFEDHTPTEFGIENIGKIVDLAAELGVNIAFENTEGEEYLAAVMDAFKNRKNVGFCWDTGHEMCYNYSKDMTALYGDRLIATHINDNLGIKDFDGKITYIDDLHLLPFDGIADWENIAARLNRCGFDGPLTFELNTESKPGRHENDIYGRMDITDYITEVYKRACRVAALCSKK